MRSSRPTRWPFTPATGRDPVANDSRGYNYYEWNATSRKAAAEQITAGHPAAAPCAGAARPRPPDPSDLPAGRTRPLLGGPDALDRAQHVGADPFLDRLSNRQRGRRRLPARALPTSTPSARERRCGTTSGQRDLARLPDELVCLYDDETSRSGELVYRPPLDGHSLVRSRSEKMTWPGTARVNPPRVAVLARTGC